MSDPISSKRRYAAGLMKHMSKGIGLDLRSKYKPAPDDAQDAFTSKFVDEENGSPEGAEDAYMKHSLKPEETPEEKETRETWASTGHAPTPKTPPVGQTPSTEPGTGPELTQEMVHPEDEHALHKALAHLEAKRGG